MAVAKDTIILGRHGEIHAGDEVPATWVDSAGDRHDTDFKRLEELGLVDKAKKGKRRHDARKRKADEPTGAAPNTKDQPGPSVREEPPPPPDPKPQAEAESHRADSKKG